MVINQDYIFLIFILNGFAIGLIFDFFRILRKSFKTNDIITYIEDILFWIITGLIILYTTFIFNNGEIRLFMFLALFLGVFIYILLFSNIIIQCNVKIIKTIKNILSKIINIISIPFKYFYIIFRKIIFKPISFTIINLKKLTNISKKIKKNTKINKKSQKNL